MSQNFNFDSSLILKSRVVFNDLNSNAFSVFMIDSFKSLSEASLTKFFNYLKSISKMVFEYDFVVASFVVEPSVVFF